MKLDSPKWRPRLSKGNRLLGPYPEIIELGEENLPKLNSSHSHLIIQNDSRVRSIIINLPCNVVGLNYLVIAGLPALEQLRLVGQLGENWSNVLWMSIKNVPMLKRVCLTGDICSLEVDGAASLIELDMSACPRMDRVRIVSPRFDLNVNVNGCLKLRGIVGIDGQLAVSSGLAEQVSRNQDKSRRDLTLYQSMTFTDLDLVLDLVNDGVKAMSRAGQGWMPFQSRSILGYYDLMAYDPKFRPVTYRILNPLEPVYTGGTGEVYAYASELLHVDADDLEIGRFEIGNHSPEECLEYILEGSGLAGYLLNGLRPGEDLPSTDLVPQLRAAKGRRSLIWQAK